MRKLLALSFSIFSLAVLAQESESIVTDRPTQSAAVHTVGKGNLLVESGFFIEKTNAFQSLVNFNSLFRFGISDRVELRLTTNYDRFENDEVSESSLGSTSLGTKIFLFASDNSLPDISVIGQLNLPTGQFNDETTGEIRFNFQSTLSDAVSLGYNLGLFISPEDSNELSPFYSFVVGASIIEGLTVFAEPYAFFNDPVDHRFNAGVIYLVNPRFQVDVSGGVGISDTSPDSFVSIGAAIGF
ncbi:MAG: transporter [Ekhidna sp.]|nr:transporter [Ekhidna sp.]